MLLFDLRENWLIQCKYLKSLGFHLDLLGGRVSYSQFVMASKKNFGVRVEYGGSIVMKVYHLPALRDTFFPT